MKKKYFKKTHAIVCFLGLLLITLTSPVVAEEFAIIVNAANNTQGSDKEMRQQVRRIFMKQQSTWTGNISAFPLDRNKNDATHIAFLKNIIRMSEQEIASHWLRVKQQQGTTPPRIVGSTRILLRLVEKKEGGMGIVKISDLSNAPKTIKVLFRFND